MVLVTNLLQQKLAFFSRCCFRGYNEVLNGLADDGWSVTEGDGVDDVCVSVNSSPSKAINCNAAFNSGLPIVSNSALCAKASMLLQGPPCNHDTFFLEAQSNFSSFFHTNSAAPLLGSLLRSQWADGDLDAFLASATKPSFCNQRNLAGRRFSCRRCRWSPSRTSPGRTSP
jgi:homeobox-leucine zipper protein